MGAGRSGKNNNGVVLGMNDRTRIGVKYCGGCNSSYERVEMIQQVQSQLKDRFLFLRYDEPDIKVLILMNGCLRSCAAQDLNQTKVPLCSINEESDFITLMNWLTLFDEKGDF
jgi:hypothetical protein